MAEINNTTAAKWSGDPESYTPAKYIEAAEAEPEKYGDVLDQMDRTKHGTRRV